MAENVHSDVSEQCVTRARGRYRYCGEWILMYLSLNLSLDYSINGSTVHYKFISEYGKVPSRF